MKTTNKQSVVTYDSLSKALSLIKGSLSPSQTFGLLYAVLTGPVSPNASNYLPSIFNGQQPATLEDAKVIVGEIMTLHNQILDYAYRLERQKFRPVYSESKMGLRKRVEDMLGEVRGYRLGLAIGGLTEKELDKDVPAIFERLKTAFAAVYEIDNVFSTMKGRISKEDQRFYSDALDTFDDMISGSFLDIFYHYQGRRAPTLFTQSKQSPSASIKLPGRNDLCPCGSGKKFKFCHGAGGKFTIH